MHSGYFLIDLEKDETLSTGWLINSTIELLEDEIDIQSIEELILNDCDVWTGKTNTDLINNKINELIKTVNQLTKEIKSIKEKQ